MSEALIVRNDAALEVNFTEQAARLKRAALQVAALIGKVTNQDEQDAAVLAQTEIQRVLSLAEKARVACKEPVLKFGKTIDAAARTFVAELTDEMTRVSKLVGDFQMLEQAKARAAEHARNQELQQIERERAAKIAEAKSHEEVEAIHEQFAIKAADLPIHEVARSDGQRVTQDWNVIVTDIHLLYRCHPNCVDVKPRLSEIKNLLKLNVKVNGINAEPIVKAGVRVGKEQRAIDV